MVLDDIDEQWVQEMFEQGFDVKSVLEVLPHASRSAIYRKLQNFRTFGATRRPLAARARKGRRRLITEHIETFLVELLAQKSDLWQDEMIFEVWSKFGVLVSQSTMSLVLKRLRWSKKVAVRVAAQRDQVERARYEHEVRTYSEEMLLFVDESNVGEKTLFRRTAWSPIGLPAITTSVLRNSTRCSVLPAYSIEGSLPGTTLVVEGSVTQLIFEDWLEHRVLPQCAPFPGRRSVLIMDNCNTHHGRTLELCEAAQVRLLYLPRYSPDYNPIESTFHLMKQWLRRHRDLAPQWGVEDYTNLWIEHLKGASYAWQQGVNHRSLFRKARVRVDIEEDD